MKTAFGYIGADSFTRQRQGQGRGGKDNGAAPAVAVAVRPVQAIAVAVAQALAVAARPYRSAVVLTTTARMQGFAQVRRNPATQSLRKQP
jgi:hypothetical protein